jgi:hypothetical protein
MEQNNEQHTLSRNVHVGFTSKIVSFFSIFRNRELFVCVEKEGKNIKKLKIFVVSRVEQMEMVYRTYGK